MKASRLCTYQDWSEPWFARHCAGIGETPRPHRKQWEYVAISEALAAHGMLASNRLGLGFAVGTEPLPAYFASQGCTIMATDQPTNANAQALWGRSQQHSSTVETLRSWATLTPEQQARIEFAALDMNTVPGWVADEFDFCWSACALEHLGSLAHGLLFVLASLSCLRPGGVAVHTTEYNLSSNDITNDHHPNNIYRNRDIERLRTLVLDLGHRMSAVDYTWGEHAMERDTDDAGWTPVERLPHLSLRIDGFRATSILLVIQKGTA